MKITDTEYRYIETNLLFYGIDDPALKDDLTDHICTHVEQSTGADFEAAYQQAISNLGGYAALQLMQRQIREKQVIRGLLMRKKIFYMLSSFNLMLLSLGLLFKLNQWPYSSVLLAVACGLLVFVSMPYWFYERYRYNAQKAIQTNK